MGPGASKINQNNAQEHPKSIKTVPRSAPKAILEAGRFQERSQGGPVSIFLNIIGVIWAILVPFGAELGAKGPKNQAF